MAVGCYVPQYKTCSFKGVSAICVDAEMEGGRRGAEGEMPFSETTAYADLGRRIRRFRVSVAFRENSHLADALAFFRVCESPGPGTLVHPNYGAIQAACRTIRVKDSPETSQGETTADIDFVEANRWVNGFGLLRIAGLNIIPLIEAARGLFSSVYAAANIPFFAAPQIAGVSTSLVGEIRTQLLLASGLRDDREFWRVAHDLDAIASTALPSADRIWIGVSGGFAAIDRYGLSPELKVAAYRALANAVALLPKPAAAVVEAQDALAATTRLLAAGYLGRAAMQMPAQTMQDGFRLYDSVVSLIDTETSIARETCNDALFITLRSFSAEVQSALLNRIYQLPAVVEYDFHGPVFSVVAAYDVYDDAKRFGVIESYNARQLPFMMGPRVAAPAATST